MDTNTLILLVVVVALFVLLVLAAILIFPRVKANLKGPAAIGVGVDDPNDQPLAPPGAIVEDAKSTEGNVRSIDEQGGGAVVRRAKAKGDIEAINKNPIENNHPKASGR
jgi:hypothetical protein